jgi:enediyne biosynthesis protein E4
MTGWIGRHAKRGVALLMVLGAYAAARPPELSSRARLDMAARFRFVPTVLPESSQPGATVRQVHPSLQRISAWVSTVGASVALADLDGDGLPNDVCLVDPRHDRVTIAAVGAIDRYPPFDLGPGSPARESSTVAPMGCLAADLNEDGRRDLVVYFWGRTPLAFLRLDGSFGSEAFEPVEIVAGTERWYSNAATLADLDGDGHDDLIVGNYFPDGARILDRDATGTTAMQHSMSNASNGGTKHFLLWAGATTGSHPSVRFTPANPGAAAWATGWTLAAAAADLDGDLLPELYFANDFGPDQLLHNRSSRGALRFEPLRGVRHLTTPKSKVLGDDSFKGMGVDMADLDGDGVTDIVVSNIAEEFALEESHFAFIGTGDAARMRTGTAPYVDRSEALGLSRSGWGWDAKVADFDNDSTAEVLQATGFIRGSVNRWAELHELAMSNDTLLSNPTLWPHFQPGTQLSPGRLFFFVRSPGGRYQDLSPDVGLGRAQISRGLAIADVDNDGRLDFAVANQWEPSFLYSNVSPAPGAFLQLAVLRDPAAAGVTTTTGPPRGTAIPAIGAEVTVRLPDDSRRTAHVDGGNGHSGRRSPEVHFGLGPVARDRALPVAVRWRARDGSTRAATLALEPGAYTLRVPW